MSPSSCPEQPSPLSFFDKARRTADWICVNQYIGNPDWPEGDDPEFDMHEDMNFGRFVRNYDMTKRKIVHLSTNWLTGMAAYGLLALADFFDDAQNYTKSALRSAWYLRCLQNTLETDPVWLGAINERISSNRWCAPRDALSAAWGFLRMHRAAPGGDYLRRAELFADWHRRCAMPGGYPFGYVYFDGKPSPDELASCQGGSLLFYDDMYAETGDPRYLDTMTTLADYYITHFFEDNGAPIILYNPVTGYRGDRVQSPEWSDMHKFNDDFGMLGLLATHARTGKSAYRETADRYIRWVVSQQQDNGGFGRFQLSVSSCVAALNLLNMHLITGEDVFRDAAYRALKHFETSVVDAPGDPAIHGGVLGLDVVRLAKDMLCLRSSMYALLTFLLFGLYEHGNQPGADIPRDVRDNPMFPGLRVDRPLD